MAKGLVSNALENQAIERENKQLAPSQPRNESCLFQFITSRKIKGSLGLSPRNIRLPQFFPAWNQSLHLLRRQPTCTHMKWSPPRVLFNVASVKHHTFLRSTCSTSSTRSWVCIFCNLFQRRQFRLSLPWVCSPKNACPGALRYCAPLCIIDFFHMTWLIPWKFVSKSGSAG